MPWFPIQLLTVHAPLGAAETLNGNVKVQPRRGRDRRNLNQLLLEARRLGATRTNLVVI